MIKLYETVPAPIEPEKSKWLTAITIIASVLLIAAIWYAKKHPITFNEKENHNVVNHGSRGSIKSK